LLATITFQNKKIINSVSVTTWENNKNDSKNNYNQNHFANLFKIGIGSHPGRQTSGQVESGMVFRRCGP
jgi:hypothetical protein